MIYVAVDPGLVSGIAYFNTHTEHFSTAESGAMDWVCDEVRMWAGRQPALAKDTTLIVERFLISERTIKTKVYYDSIHFEGWIRLEYPDTYAQTAAQAKGFATDSKLKHLGWYTKTKDGHANDAARHLLYRAVKDRVPYVIDRLKEYDQ